MCLFCVYWLSKVKHFSNVRTFISDGRGYQLFELNLFERLFEGEIFDFQVKIIETCKANYVCLMIAWPDRCRAPGTKMGPDNWSSCHNVIVDDNRLIWHSSRRPDEKDECLNFLPQCFLLRQPVSFTLLQMQWLGYILVPGSCSRWHHTGLRKTWAGHQSVMSIARVAARIYDSIII